jgi:hypothetical protein
LKKSLSASGLSKYKAIVPVGRTSFRLKFHLCSSTYQPEQSQYSLNLRR